MAAAIDLAKAIIARRRIRVLLISKDPILHRRRSTLRRRYSSRVALRRSLRPECQNPDIGRLSRPGAKRSIASDTFSGPPSNSAMDSRIDDETRPPVGRQAEVAQTDEHHRGGDEQGSDPGRQPFVCERGDREDRSHGEPEV